ncbi:hypothetical protein ACHAPC_002372 [Botrytis cinerea]
MPPTPAPNRKRRKASSTSFDGALTSKRANAQSQFNSDDLNDATGSIRSIHSPSSWSADDELGVSNRDLEAIGDAWNQYLEEQDGIKIDLLLSSTKEYRKVYDARRKAFKSRNGIISMDRDMILSLKKSVILESRASDSSSSHGEDSEDENEHSTKNHPQGQWLCGEMRWSDWISLTALYYNL